MRAALSAASRAAETGRGSQALVGTVPPSDRSPRLLFGPLTSNEERAGRKGRGCGGAGPARGAGGRGWRGHVTASLAPGQGGGALPGSSSPPRAPWLGNSYRLINNSCARTLISWRRDPAPATSSYSHPRCSLQLSQGQPEATSSSVRTRRKNSEG